MPHVDSEELKSVVRGLVADHPNVGMGVGIAGPDGLTDFVGYGVADLRRGTPFTADAGIRIASISKTMTAIAVMQLVEQGRIDLDAPAERYLRSYRLVAPRSDSPRPTVRHLLTHTAGLPELAHTSGMLRADFGESIPLGRPRPPLAQFYGGEIRLRAEPGSRFVYGNHSPATLGQIVEDVTSSPLGTYLREHVFRPLGMTATTTDLAAAAPTLATGYEIRNRRVEPIALREMITVGAAGVCSTPRDMGRYLAALLRGGSLDDASILAPETLATMIAPHVQPDPRIPGVGLIFFRTALGRGVVAAGHQGTLPGFHSQILFLPDAGVAAMVVTTGSREADFWVPGATARVLRLAAGLPESGTVAGPHHPQVWDNICGWYRLEAGLTDVRLRGLLGAGAEIFLRDGLPALRFLTPIPQLARGFALEPADGDDPYVFQVRLGGPDSIRIVIGCDGGRATRLHLEVMPLTLTKRPEATNPRRWAAAALGGGLAAALGTAIGRRS